MPKNGPKISTKYIWEEFDALDDLPIADVDIIRQTLLHIKASPCGDDLRFFFKTTLAPWYDRVVFSGLSRDAANLIYRLSDLVEPEVRRTIEVFQIENELWYSLEDWRRQFTGGLRYGSNDVPVFLGTPPQLPGM